MLNKITWDKANFHWDNNHNRKASYTWDEVALVIEAAGETFDYTHPLFDKDPEKKKKLVKLICKVQGKTITKEKEIKDYKITVEDIQLLTEKVIGINVKVL